MAFLVVLVVKILRNGSLHDQAASTYKKGGSALRRRNGAPTSEVLPIRLPISEIPSL